MSISYVGLDLGSSVFHQVAIKSTGSVTVNRDFSTSELNLRKAFADFRGEVQWLGPHRLSKPDRTMGRPD